MAYCEISLGFADPALRINGLVTDRASLEDIAKLRGFATIAALEATV